MLVVLVAVPWWCPSGVRGVILAYFGDVPIMSWLLVSCRCFRWCPICVGVYLVASWWCCVGVLVAFWWCPGGFDSGRNFEADNGG